MNYLVIGDDHLGILGGMYSLENSQIFYFSFTGPFDHKSISFFLTFFLVFSKLQFSHLLMRITISPCGGCDD